MLTIQKIHQAFALGFLFLLSLLTLSIALLKSRYNAESQHVNRIDRTMQDRREKPQEPLEGDSRKMLDRVALPLGVGRLLSLDAFEWETCEISPRLADSIGIESQDRNTVSQIVNICVENFKVLESQKAEVVNNNGQYYIKLNQCENEAKVIFEETYRQLEEVIGKNSSLVILSILRRQLRSGGKSEMEVGFVKTSDGRFLLSEKVLDSDGIEISLRESEFVVRPSLNGNYRWSHLSDIFESGIE